jgi:hypothetical protein
MESHLMSDILQAAIEERYRLEAVLRSNSDFQRLEAVRRVIALYEGVVQVPTRVDPVANYDLGHTHHPDYTAIPVSSSQEGMYDDALGPISFLGKKSRPIL